MNKILDILLSPAGKALWLALDDTHNWKRDKHFTITYKEKFTFWIANGGSFLEGHYNNRIKFGIIERHILYYKIKKLLRNAELRDADTDAKRFAEYVQSIETLYD